jgi:hypothetical protein
LIKGAASWAAAQLHDQAAKLVLGGGPATMRAAIENAYPALWEAHRRLSTRSTIQPFSARFNN